MNQSDTAITATPLAVPTCLWSAGASLGESPLWDPHQQCLYWLDIKNCLLHQLVWRTGQQCSWPLAEMVTSLALTAVPGRLLASCRHRLAWLCVDAGAASAPRLAPVINLDQQCLTREPRTNRFNDAKVDPLGRLWAGTMDDGEQADSGHLYRVHQGEVTRVDSGYCITNGPTFSPGGDILYHTSTTARTTFAFDVADNGELANKRVFYRMPDAQGYPDGMTTDSEGCIWLCHFFGGQLTRLSPAGEVLARVPMPVSNITSCCFGGPHRDILFITTARWALTTAQRTAEPLAGGLFAFKPGVTGLPAAVCEPC